MGWLILGALGLFALARSASRSSTKKPPAKTVGAHPTPPIQTLPGTFEAFAPVKADPSTPNVHTLTTLDLSVPVPVFATAAGFSSVDALVDRNPDFTLLEPEEANEWPPLVSFDFVVRGTSDVATYTPTGRLGALDVPTYVTPDGLEWSFPTFERAKPWDIKSGRPSFEGDAPFAETKRSVPAVFVEPMPVAPFLRRRAIVPWTVGTKITLP